MPASQEEVICALWSISKGCENSLDRYEDYPSLYIKRYISIELHTSMMFYQMKRTGLRFKPKDEYFNLITDGYKDFGIPVSQISKALKNTKL